MLDPACEVVLCSFRLLAKLHDKRPTGREQGRPPGSQTSRLAMVNEVHSLIDISSLSCHQPTQRRR